MELIHLQEQLQFSDNMKTMSKAIRRLSLFITMTMIVIGATANEVKSPPPCHTVDISGVDVMCYGGNNGSALIFINDGSGDYSISWSNGVDDQLSISNLEAGAYSVQVVDNVTGCSVSSIITINQPNELACSLTYEDVACFGQADGVVDLSVSGGVQDYSYTWSNGATAQDITGLSAGQYFVTVMDANSCSITTSATISQPTQALGSTLSSTEILCHDDANASVDIDVWGGTNPYYYNWNTGALSQDINNIPSGDYTVSITDANGCSMSQSVSISNPEELDWTKSSGNNLCAGDTDGFVGVNVSGGTEPYNYQWADNDFMLSFNQPELENLAANQYFVTVTDAHACSFSTNFEVTSPEAIELSSTSVNVSQQGGNDGSIDLSVTGGVEDYSYSWSNGVTSEDLSELVAGIYVVTVTDYNACVESVSIEIVEPLDALGFEYISTNTNCYGSADGTIQIFPEGGISPYQILWSNGSELEILNNLYAGLYYCTITDANDIQYVDSIEILQPNPLSFEYSSINPACFAANSGSIDVTVSGGTEPYRYQWYDPDYAMAGQTDSVSNARAGEYTLNVIDTLGCENTLSVMLTQPEMIELNLTGEDVLCYGASTGWINSSVSGGTPGYTYEWSNGETTENIIELSVGKYVLTVSDNNSCQVFAELELNQPDSIEIVFSSSLVSCNAQSDGSINTFVEGGSGAYNYLWSNDEITSDIENLTEGYYALTVTDIFNCTVIDSTFVAKNDVDCINIPSSFTPNADGYNDTWVIRNAYLFPDCHLIVLNKWGTSVFESTGYDTEWDGTYEGSVLPSGTYYYMFRISPDNEERTGTITILK